MEFGLLSSYLSYRVVWLTCVLESLIHAVIRAVNVALNTLWSNSQRQTTVNLKLSGKKIPIQRPGC